MKYRLLLFLVVGILLFPAKKETSSSLSINSVATEGGLISGNWTPAVRSKSLKEFHLRHHPLEICAGKLLNPYSHGKGLKPAQKILLLRCKILLFHFSYGHLNFWYQPSRFRKIASTSMCGQQQKNQTKSVRWWCGSMGVVLDREEALFHFMMEKIWQKRDRRRDH